MEADSRNTTLGNVEIILRAPKDLTRSSNNLSRRPKVIGNRIYIPNDPKVKIIKFTGTTECLVVVGCGEFGHHRLQTLWCGDRLGKPFAFGFTVHPAKVARKGDLNQFLEFIKPKRTSTLSEYDEVFGKPTLYDTLWVTKIPNNYPVHIGIASMQLMTVGKVKIANSINHLGENELLNHTSISTEHGIKEFKVNGKWSAIANHPTIHCSSSHDVHLHDGNYFLEPSRFQVYLPRKLNGR
jgi:hypothetical protein